MKNVKMANVGVIVMDKKERHFMDDLEHHTIEKSTEEMDEKLNEVRKKHKEYHD